MHENTHMPCLRIWKPKNTDALVCCSIQSKEGLLLTDNIPIFLTSCLKISKFPPSAALYGSIEMKMLYWSDYCSCF